MLTYALCATLGLLLALGFRKAESDPELCTLIGIFSLHWLFIAADFLSFLFRMAFVLLAGMLIYIRQTGGIVSGHEWLLRAFVFTSAYAITLFIARRLVVRRMWYRGCTFLEIGFRKNLSFPDRLSFSLQIPYHGDGSVLQDL